MEYTSPLIIRGFFVMKTNYFKRHEFVPLVNDSVDSQLGICVVIPSYNEYDLNSALSALANCHRPKCSVEVLVVINFPEGSADEIVANAKECIQIVTATDARVDDKRFRFIPISAFHLPKKHAGVGLARKTGMDEAAWRLMQSKSEHKIIAGFDADSSCATNYLVELEKLWLSEPKTRGCSIYYEHPIHGEEFGDEVYGAIAQYELHLRYYVYSARHINHPFSFQTVGSSLACSAQTYVDIGGMSRRKAGEDFYFLQKIIPHGHFYELNSTAVYPSSRPSDRVPFGTGRAISNHVDSGTSILLTYEFESFLTLKDFLTFAPNQLYNASRQEIEKQLEKLPAPLKEYLLSLDFYKSIEEINGNTANRKSFIKRFFLWFDAFQLLKYLNWLHTQTYTKKAVRDEVEKLAIRQFGYSGDGSVADLLQFYRKMDRESNFEVTL